MLSSTELLRGVKSIVNLTKRSTRRYGAEPLPSPRLLLLTENFYPTDSSGGRLLSALAEDLVARGVEVKVLTSRGNYRGNRRVGLRETHNGVQIRRLPTGFFSRDWPVGRLINEVVLTIGMFLAVLLQPRLDRVMFTSSPPFLAPAVTLAARLRQADTVFITMDLYPEMAAATGLIGRGTLAYRCWDALSSFAIRNTSSIVVLGRCMKQVLLTKLADHECMPLVIPNWADGRQVHPLDPTEENRFLRKYPQLRDKFIVQYSGNFGRFHDFETILRAAACCRGQSEIAFALIGHGAQRPWLEREIETRELDNVHLLPFQPQEDLPHSLAAQSVALVTLERGTEGLCVPSKFYPVLAAGKPVIAVMDRFAEVALVVEEERIGFVVAQNDVDALVASIRKLSSSPELCADMGARARRVQQEKFDRSNAVEKYYEVLMHTGKWVPGV